MKGKIKVLSLLVAVAMTASVFAGCADKGTADDKSSAPATGDKSSTADVSKEADKFADKVNLKWYHWGPSPAKPDDVMKALNEKTLADINTEVEIIFANDEEAVKMMTATGGEYDIVFSCNWYNNFVANASAGFFADITDVVPTAAPDLWDFIPQGVWDGAKVGGKIYAVPVYKDTAPTQYWMANTEYVFDKADAKAEFEATDGTLASVTPLLEKVKAYADAGNPYPNDLTAPFNFNVAGLNGHDNGWDAIDSGSLTGVKLSEGKTVMNYLEDADYVADLKVLKDWNNRGLVNQNAMQTETEPVFLVVGTVQAWEGAEATLNTKFKTNVALNHKFGPVFTTAGVQGSMNAFSPSSKNLERALQYMEYTNLNADYRNMLAYGIEGVNWKKDAEGRAERITKDDWAPGAFSQATFFTMLPEAPATADSYLALKTIMDSADSSSILGFVPDLTSVEAEQQACAAIIEPVKKELLTGSVKDVDAKVKETLDRLKSAGYDVLKKTIQDQVDAFLAAK